MKSLEIRKMFLDYYQKNGHRLIGYSSLIPIDDPTLLLINSGMAALKHYFSGVKEPPYPKLCNIQKCIRTNDIESVGDDHHLTFFEMMGNWSIGDYFKEKAIKLAWKLITEIFGFDTKKIYVTIYGGDDTMPEIPSDIESMRIWQEVIKIPADHIVSLGAESNFWGPAGNTGPCGPCSEIFFDRGIEYGCGQSTCNAGCECGRFLEIWNPGVFMQYYSHEDNTLTELPFRSVDAGAGLERFSLVLQKVNSVYETDLLSPIVESITSKTISDDKLKSVRIIADHIRCATFMIADGIYPGKSKREYILRRLLRRSIVHASMANISTDQFIIAAKTVINNFSEFYPNLKHAQSIIESIIKTEISNFGKTLKRSLKELEKIIKRSGGKISGKDAFTLHETFGLPFDLTREIIKSCELEVDEKDFLQHLEDHKEKSRKGG